MDTEQKAYDNLRIQKEESFKECLLKILEDLPQCPSEDPVYRDLFLVASTNEILKVRQDFSVLRFTVKGENGGKASIPFEWIYRNDIDIKSIERFLSWEKFEEREVRSGRAE